MSLYQRQLEREVEHWKAEAELQRQRALKAEGKLALFREQLKRILSFLEKLIEELGGTVPPF